MDKKYKNIIETLKEKLEKENILDYLQNNFTQITNIGVGEKYEKDFNLSTLCRQKRLKSFSNKADDTIVEVYNYNIAPNGYFITYNKFDKENNQVQCEIFI